MNALRQVLKKIDKSRFLEKSLISMIHSVPFFERKLFEFAAFSGKPSECSLDSHAEEVLKKLKKGIK